jgi:fumarate hydratase subunit alpha
VGVGIGGTFEKAAELSKAALLRPIDKVNPDRALAKLEGELMHGINLLNIGPMGLGGKTTALGVNIMSFPTHIAGLPVAVCISCHATRSAQKVI